MSEQQNQQPQGGAPQQGQAAGQQDALDKGISGALDKAGYHQGNETVEKISDGARGFFKKITGKDVPIADKQ